MTSLTPFQSRFPFSRWMEDVDDLMGRVAPWERRAPASWAPMADVTEEPEAYVVKAEVPGMSADDIRVDLSGDVLTIAGEKKQEETKDTESRRLVERRYGSFERTFAFPTPVDSERVEAELRDGVLHVRVPKTREQKAKKIAVRQG